MLAFIAAVNRARCPCPICVLLRSWPARLVRLLCRWSEVVIHLPVASGTAEIRRIAAVMDFLPDSECSLSGLLEVDGAFDTPRRMLPVTAGPANGMSTEIAGVITFVLAVYFACALSLSDCLCCTPCSAIPGTTIHSHQSAEKWSCYRVPWVLRKPEHHILSARSSL